MVLFLIIGVTFVFFSSAAGLFLSIRKFRKLVAEFREDFENYKVETDSSFDKNQG